MSDPQTPRTFDVLVTASEAYPRLEHEFLSAQSDIVAGFRVFDPWTKLRSDTGLGVGDDWFDLITHTLNRGVSIKLYLTDFDPVVRMGMHLYAWRCLRGLIAAGEASDHPENLDVQVKMHPARVGLIPRIALWLRSFKEIGDQIDRITADQGISSTEIIKTAPRVRNLTVWKGDRLQARKFPPPPLVPVTHHQKLAVFDNTRLYVGGLDLNDRRFDTPDHEQPSEETWHDMQVIVSGQAAAEARLHLLGMDDWFTGSLSKRPQKILRTISTRRAFSLPFMSPRSAINEIENSHRDAIGRSEELIYFESQFFRDEALARCLAKRAARTPGLSMVMMLPAAPEEIAFQDSWGPDAKFGEHQQVK